MSDPFNDPRFPARPTHLDYLRLMGVVAYLDGEATEGARGAGDVAGQFVDPESLTYMALNRARMLLQKTGLTHIPEVLIASVWMDAFCAGAQFQREGGKRPPNPV